MAEWKENRLLAQRPLPQDGYDRRAEHSASRTGQQSGLPARSATVNLAESPLGWLKSRGQVSERQYEAGERLRSDWEIAGLGQRVTMQWDAPPIGRSGRAAPAGRDPVTAQIDAQRRFDAAVAAAGPGLSDILWRVVCSGEGMRSAEQALGWPARSGKLVLGLSLDRVADFYGLC